MERSAVNAEKGSKIDSSKRIAPRARPARENTKMQLDFASGLVQRARCWGCGSSLELMALGLASMPATQRRAAALSLQRAKGNRFVQGLAVQAKREPNCTGMPDQLKAGIETLSGFDMSDVRVHANSDRPAQLNAMAYTQGNQIHLGPGQERHLPHEAWHVVQQKQGRVRPMTKFQGITINYNTSMESEADIMGFQANRELQVSGPMSLHSGITPSQPHVLQGYFVYKDYKLDDYCDKIKDYLENKYDKKVVDDFNRICTLLTKTEFDKWAKKKGVDWISILKEVVKINPDDEPWIFGQRMEGMPLSGYIPVKPVTREKKLRKVPRSGPGSYDYKANEDSRIIQVLRQISTQIFLYLDDSKGLAENEQEIQTMWSYGNLIIASNQEATSSTLFKKLTDDSTKETAKVLHGILVEEHSKERRDYLKELSARLSSKFKTLYHGMRLTNYEQIKNILEILANGRVHIIQNVMDEAQTKPIKDGSGSIYILSAPSLHKYIHAEQRLIELRDILGGMNTAWVAGKKRPCFGCWVREVGTKERSQMEGTYRLVFQDQPGKAFKGTYRSAPPEERIKWRKSLEANPDLMVYESEHGQGTIGPESESEAEMEIDFGNPRELVDAMGEDKLTQTTREALEYYFKAADKDFNEVQNLAKKRKREGSLGDTDREKVIAAMEKLRELPTKLKKPILPSIMPFRFKPPQIEDLESFLQPK